TRGHAGDDRSCAPEYRAGRTLGSASDLLRLLVATRPGRLRGSARPLPALPGARPRTGEYPGRFRRCEGVTMRGTRSPNIVILYADDLGCGDLGCFGADDIPTPHLDALCRDGVKLSRWYSNSPVCSPSRAALLTGKHPAHAGVETILGGSRRTPGLPPQPT